MQRSLQSYFASPCIKQGISVLHRKRRAWHEIHFYSNTSGEVKSYKFNQKGFECVLLLNGAHSADAIAAKTRVSIASANRLIKILSRAGVLAIQDYRHEDAQFESQADFLGPSEIDPLTRMTKHQALRSAHVAIVGVGGIGSWAAYGLALSGVGTLTLIDPDVVEARNLGTQALYTTNDIGNSKVRSLAKHLARIRPLTTVHAVLGKLTQLDGSCLPLDKVDLVMACADEPSVDAVNRLVSTAAQSSEIAHILCGGYDGHISFVGPTIIPHKTPCWSCYEFSIQREKRMGGLTHLPISRSDIQGGTIAPLAAITANLHVLEAIKVITGWSKPSMIGRTAEIDFGKLAISYRRFRRRPSCKLCRKK